MSASGAQQDTLRPGSRFGPYQVQECIGQGAMARVYRALHTVLNKQVALKVLSSAVLEESQGRKRFIVEGRAAAAVKHPHVVDITDVGVCDGLPYLVMELLEGQDLQHFLAERGPLSEEELARIFLPVMAGLSAAHDRGVVHRDLKPGNIFLAKDPEGGFVPKVLDFGISKLAQTDDFEASATPHNSLLGTPLYLPPEALEGSHGLTPLADQYSLGVVMYEALAGKPPFEGTSLISLITAIHTRQMTPLRQIRPELSPTVTQLVERMMSLRPEERFPGLREAGRLLWRQAAYRTQMVWGRVFGGDVAPQASAPSTGPGLVSPRPDRDEGSVGQTSTLRLARGRRGWLAVSVLVVGVTAIGLWSVGSSVEADSPSPREVRKVQALESAQARNDSTSGPPGVAQPERSATAPKKEARVAAAGATSARPGGLHANGRPQPPSEDGAAPPVASAPAVKAVRTPARSKRRRRPGSAAARNEKAASRSRSPRRAAAPLGSSSSAEDFDAPTFDWDEDEAAGRAPRARGRSRRGGEGARRRIVPLGANSAPILE